MTIEYSPSTLVLPLLAEPVVVVGGGGGGGG
jgi:hypothetical protein